MGGGVDEISGSVPYLSESIDWFWEGFGPQHPSYNHFGDGGSLALILLKETGGGRVDENRCIKQGICRIGGVDGR